MKIVRADITDTHIFSEEKLAHGACCFYTEDKQNSYYFEINGQEAILHADENKYIDSAIEKFLFFSGFITCIKTPCGQVLQQRDSIKLEATEISKIQPSQFYINEVKLEKCKRWIKSEKDIFIPVAIIDGKVWQNNSKSVSPVAENALKHGDFRLGREPFLTDFAIIAQDGHTRLRAAYDLGYTHVPAYQEGYDKYLLDFAQHAEQRKIFSVSDMEVVSNEEYKVKWHKFCDDFFERNRQ